MIGGPKSPYTVNTHPKMENDQNYQIRTTQYQTGMMRLKQAGEMVRKQWKELEFVKNYNK